MLAKRCFRDGHDHCFIIDQPNTIVLFGCPITVGFSSIGPSNGASQRAKRIGFLNTDDQVDWYKISAGAGNYICHNYIMISMADTSEEGEAAPHLEIFDPYNTRIFSRSDSSVIRHQFSASQGTYTVSASDRDVFSGSDSGPYEIHFVRAPGANGFCLTLNAGPKA